MCSLVMSLCLREFSMTSLDVYKNYKNYNNILKGLWDFMKPLKIFHDFTAVKSQIYKMIHTKPIKPMT